MQSLVERSVIRVKRQEKLKVFVFEDFVFERIPLSILGPCEEDFILDVKDHLVGGIVHLEPEAVLRVRAYCKTLAHGGHQQ
jgi:hypothetical protein